MPRMIELIRQSAVPANVVRSAARGALTLPAGEMMEILVYLTTSSIFAEQAKMTLAGWDEAGSIKVASDPATPWEVLQYLIAPENLRPALFPALLENHSVREANLMEIASACSPELIAMMMKSRRVQQSSQLLHALLGNPKISTEDAGRVEGMLKSLGEGTTQIQAYEEVEQAEKTQFEIDHAAEIAAEEAAAKPFTLFGEDEEEELQELAPEPEAAEAQRSVVPVEEIPIPVEEHPVAAEPTAAKESKPAAPKAPPPAGENVRERISTLQKIARLSVGDRIQLGMKGSKEERFILIRDGSKLVSQAVLASPKVSDGEIEMFAGMKNVQEGVLREIARNHKYMKNYAVVRTLTNNPRCPLDLSLTLMGHMLVNDLKALSMNKNIPETLRKLALKRFKDKTEKKSGGG